MLACAATVLAEFRLAERALPVGRAFRHRFRIARDDLLALHDWAARGWQSFLLIERAAGDTHVRWAACSELGRFALHPCPLVGDAFGCYGMRLLHRRYIPDSAGTLHDEIVRTADRHVPHICRAFWRVSPLA